MILEVETRFAGTTPVDCIVIPGHSIEVVTMADGEKQWKPTRLIQKMRPVGDRKFRTGERDSSLDPNDELAYVGGGNAVSIAAAHLFNQHTSMGKPPKLVIFAAGRPMYLKEKGTPDDLCEGVPMLEVFSRNVPLLEEAAPELRILADNEKTMDDVEKPLLIAHERGFKRVVFVMLGMRIERAWEYLKIAFAAHPELAVLTVEMRAAEILLWQRYLRFPHGMKKLGRIMGAFESSLAYRTTESNEAGGTKQLREDASKYKGTGNY